MDLEIIKSQYKAKARNYEQLKEECLFILEPMLKQTNIKLHSISHRVKDIESFLDKVQRKQSEDPFGEIRDIVGIRVVCLFLSDIDRIGGIIRKSFKVLDEDNKIEGSEVESFGYMSVHFTAMMKEEHSGPRYDSIANLPFEIQVRTIAMDAWANVSHYLQYKSDKDVPSELRRDFYALSGLFYVADKHFELFYTSSQQSKENMNKLFDKASPQVQRNQEINLDSLTAYLHTRFPDRRHGDAKAVSELISQLKSANYTSIDEIERAIEMGWDAFLVYEAQKPALPEKYRDVSVIRIIFNIIDENFASIGASNYPKKFLKRLAECRKLVRK